MQNHKWKLSSSATKIHPSGSEPALKTMPRVREEGGGGGEGEGVRELDGEREGGRGGEGDSETTIKDAFRHLSLALGSVPPHSE